MFFCIPANIANLPFLFPHVIRKYARLRCKNAFSLLFFCIYFYAQQRAFSSAQRNCKPPLFPNTDRKKRRTASAMRRNSCSSKIFLSLKSFSFSEKYFFTQTSLFRYSVCVKEKIFLSFPLFPDFFPLSISCDKRSNHPDSPAPRGGAAATGA